MSNEIEKAEIFWNELLKWYRENSREFPWRSTEDPFHILVAEFLLQQTHVRKVEEAYIEIIRRYPDPAGLAEAEIEEIEDIIKPLGLIYRAERIINAAKTIAVKYEGKVPGSAEELKEIYGVGQYISGAVRCYAFGEKAVPVDTNVIRLFRRFFGFSSDKIRPRTDGELRRKIKSTFPDVNIKDCNFAVLDFAAAVCTASNPKCGDCPLSTECAENN